MPFPKNTPYISKGNQSLNPAIEASSKYDGRLTLPYTTDQASGNTIIPEGVGVHLGADGEVEIHDGSAPLLGMVVLGNNTSEYPDNVSPVISYPLYNQKETEVMVMLEGSFVIWAVATEAISAGASVIGAGSYNTASTFAEVSTLGASTNPLGTAIDAATAQGDMIRVLVKV